MGQSVTKIVHEIEYIPFQSDCGGGPGILSRGDFRKNRRKILQRIQLIHRTRARIKIDNIEWYFGQIREKWCLGSSFKAFGLVAGRIL